MKIFFCVCFFCFSLSSFAQQDTSKSEGRAKRDSMLASKRDSVLTSIDRELNVSKGKMESALTAFSEAAESMSHIANNDELTAEEKSTQIRSIADNRDATLKSLLNENQLARLKTYIIRRKIPRKLK